MIDTLKPLVMMQLKDKIDMSFLKSPKQTVSKIMLSILGFVLITAVIYALMYVCVILNIFSLVRSFPVSVIVLLFTIMLVLSMITCTFGLMKSFYFSKDNQVLLTLPVTGGQVFLSKLVVYYFYELKKTLFFIFPMFLAFGIISSLSWLYFIWLPLALVLIAMVPVAVGALLSIPAMLITNLLKNHFILKITLFAAAIGAFVTGLVFIINMIPADLDIISTWSRLFWDIQDFLLMFVREFSMFTYLTYFITGSPSGLVMVQFTLNTLYVLLILIGSIAVLVALTFLIVRPLFLKMASKPFEYKKGLIKFKKKNKTNNSFVSKIKKEFAIIFRTPEDIFTIAGIAIALPILILLLNRIFAAMSTRLLGDFMTTGFNLLIILLITLAGSVRLASSYSREGAAGALVKTRPVSYQKILISKMVANAIFTLVAIVISVSIFSIFNPLDPFSTTMFALGIIFVYLAHLIWSVELDLMNPQHRQYSTTGVIENNPNETKSSIFAYILSFIFAGVAIFFSVEDVNMAWMKIAMIACVFLIFRIYTFYNRVKFYFKEK